MARELVEFAEGCLEVWLEGTVEDADHVSARALTLGVMVLNILKCR